ncbi:MAG: Asp23/Gls24 family envelope stress response protein [Syntrophomonas sp.]
METPKSEIIGELGAIRIADEVVSTVAGLAAIEVDGVSSLSGGWGTDFVEKLGKKNFGKGIKVEAHEDEIDINIYIIVDFGFPIPQVAEKVQKEVKLAVETMTGLNVTIVNVHVVGVAMKKNSTDNDLAAELDNE